MSHFVRSLVAMALLVVFTGCAATPAARTSPFAGYPFRHADFDFKVAWKTSPSGSGISVDGILKNVRYYQVGDVQLWVKVLNKANKVLAEESTLFMPLPLEMDDYRPFSVTLQNVALAPGDMLNFVIMYRVIDDRRSSFNWLSSFTVDAMTGAAPVKEGANPDDW